MVRHAPIHRRSGHSDIAICCGRNVLGSSPSTYGGAPLESGHHFESQTIQRIQNVFGRTLSKAASGTIASTERTNSSVCAAGTSFAATNATGTRASSQSMGLWRNSLSRGSMFQPASAFGPQKYRKEPRSGLARSPRSWQTRRHIILADGNLGEWELIRTRKDKEPQEQEEPRALAARRVFSLSFLIAFTQYLFDSLHDGHLKILLVAAIILYLTHILFQGLQINHSVVAFGIIVTAEPRGDEPRLTDFVMHELVTV